MDVIYQQREGARLGRKVGDGDDGYVYTKERWIRKVNTEEGRSRVQDIRTQAS
jgi:hypothetical protein